MTKVIKAILFLVELLPKVIELLEEVRELIYELKKDEKKESIK